VEVLRFLVSAYENTLYDIPALAEAHRQIAKYLDMVRKLVVAVSKTCTAAQTTTRHVVLLLDPHQGAHLSVVLSCRLPWRRFHRRLPR